MNNDDVDWLFPIGREGSTNLRFTLEFIMRGYGIDPSTQGIIALERFITDITYQHFSLADLETLAPWVGALYITKAGGTNSPERAQEGA